MGATGQRRVTIQAQVDEGQKIEGRGKIDPCALVIFGATGDLTSRKLIPSLYRLDQSGLLPDACAIVGFARREWSDDQFRASLREACEKFVPKGHFEAPVWERFAARLSFESGSFEDAAAYARLAQRLTELDRTRGTAGNRVLYLSTAPTAFPQILERLRPAGLVHPPPLNGDGPWSRVVIEKPFGRDLDSARTLNRLAHEVLHESQIYRIDHYLGKETVQNILVFRFGNAIFEPLWNRKYIDSVQITAAEHVGVEGRGKFYDETGVLRDLVQNHLLQVLAMCAMEPPVSFAADDVRDQTAQLLHCLRPMDRDSVLAHTVRAQYEGYAKEPGVAPDSRTPTYTALRMYIDNWRWHGVPFYMRTGKGLASKVTEVAIHFQSVPVSIFGHQESVLRVTPNTLVLRIQPNEGIALSFTSKRPGDDLAVGNVEMDFQYREVFGSEPPEAYQRLLLDCMRGDATLFIRTDSVERSWEFCTPILEAWDSDRAAPIPTYARGSQGPAPAERLISSTGHRWRRLP